MQKYKNLNQNWKQRNEVRNLDFAFGNPSKHSGVTNTDYVQSGYGALRILFIVVQIYFNYGRSKFN